MPVAVFSVSPPAAWEQAASGFTEVPWSGGGWGAQDRLSLQPSWPFIQVTMNVGYGEMRWAGTELLPHPPTPWLTKK